MCLRNSNQVLFLGKMNICTGLHQHGWPHWPKWYRRDQDQNDESALKVGPNHQCLHVQQLLLFKNRQSVVRPSHRKGCPANLVQNRRNESGVLVISLHTTRGAAAYSFFSPAGTRTPMSFPILPDVTQHIAL